MAGLAVFWNWLNAQAGWLFLAGLALVALWNWQKWRQDRALARQLRERKPPPVELRATPKVSVLVAAWNEAEMIQEHVESFLRLRYTNRELILCVGGGDDTYDIACRHASKQVIVLEQQPGEGKQRALRRCLEQASGEVIFLTDADCLLDDEAFERTLAPVVDGGEAAATGAIRPLAAQLVNPFVLHRWFIEVRSMAHSDRYIAGLLGGNTAVRRDVLKATGAFAPDVRTGTDYYLAMQVLNSGYTIRHVPESAVETHYAEELHQYWRQQTRWLRNVVMHGLRFGAYGEVARCLIPSGIGALMLSGPLWALWLGRAVLAGWLLICAHVLFSRLRYTRFGEQATGCTFPLAGYFSLPVYILADFAIWAAAVFQYPFRSRRWQW
jgi:cellulose synthase/poly-beta-1,6-N-acetylglucosamine synthase-like glycosyltransferase